MSAHSDAKATHGRLAEQPVIPEHLNILKIPAITERSGYAIETRLAQAGCGTEKDTGAITPSIVLSSTYERDRDLGHTRGFIYARESNPTRNLLEQTVASLENGAAAAAFASGMAAASAILQSIPSGHVILSDDCYNAVKLIINTTFKHWGLKMTIVDMTNLGAVEKAVAEAREGCSGHIILWLESMTNPMLKVADVAAVSEIAKRYSASTVVDATFCTPLIHRPLELGADIVMHSCTKYFGGHSDLIGGIVIGNKNSALFEDIRFIQAYNGAIMSPFDCWLTLRGLRSLGARMRVHCENAQAVAEFLESHPAVSYVSYPGLPSHPGHKIAAKQMHNMFGGMISFRIAGGKEAAIKVQASLKLAKRAASLGGTETLVEHRASAESEDTLTPWDLLRMSIGLEHKDDIINDLKQALETV